MNFDSPSESVPSTHSPHRVNGVSFCHCYSGKEPPPVIEGRGPPNHRRKPRAGTATQTPLHSVYRATHSHPTTECRRNARGLSPDILFSLVPARMAHGHHFQPKHRETKGMEWRQACILSTVSLSTDPPRTTEVVPGDVGLPSVQRSFPCVKRGQPTLLGPLHGHTFHNVPPSRRSGSCACYEHQARGLVSTTSTDGFAFTSRTVEHCPRHAPCLPAVKCFLAFLPFSVQGMEEPPALGLPHPVRCALRFSQPPDALLPPIPARVYFTSNDTPGVFNLIVIATA